VWLSPCQDCFNVLFVFGAKAMGTARQARLPRRVLALLDKAPRYPEGTGLRLAVKSARQLEVVKALALIKLSN
jgi:hypothetical protein